MGDTPVFKIAGTELTLSNLDKLLWPEDKYTKKDLIEYYIQVAPFMLPHLSDRPLVFTRYPNGISGRHFYQKNAPEYLPEWIKTFPWENEDGSVNQHIVAATPADLAWLGNQACLEIHAWLSRTNTIYHPDHLVFDLDPSEGSTWQNVVDIALLLKQTLDELGLRGYPKTSGAEGLHIYVPVVGEYSYEEIRNLGGGIAGLICTLLPDIATIERSVARRGKKVYVDYMQNVIGKTLCAPYCVRPRPGAPVSAPLYWEEVSQVSPADFTIKSILTRLNRIGDVFQPVLSDRQNVDNVRKRLGI